MYSWLSGSWLISSPLLHSPDFPFMQLCPLVTPQQSLTLSHLFYFHKKIHFWKLVLMQKRIELKMLDLPEIETPANWCPILHAALGKHLWKLIICCRLKGSTAIEICIFLYLFSAIEIQIQVHTQICMQVKILSQASTCPNWYLVIDYSFSGFIFWKSERGLS